MDPNCQVCYEKATLIAKHNNNNNNNNNNNKKTKQNYIKRRPFGRTRLYAKKMKHK